MSCPHISGAGIYPSYFAADSDDTNLIGLRPPSAAQSVHREDCTQCFDSIVSRRRSFDVVGTNEVFRTIQPDSTFAFHASTVDVPASKETMLGCTIS